MICFGPRPTQVLLMNVAMVLIERDYKIKSTVASATYEMKKIKGTLNAVYIYIYIYIYKSNVTLIIWLIRQVAVNMMSCLFNYIIYLHHKQV